MGMDLTKVVLPTFILERRSLLEMYADCMAHPDLFVNVADGKTSEGRRLFTKAGCIAFEAKAEAYRTHTAISRAECTVHCTSLTVSISSDRMYALFLWYLTSFHEGRKGAIAKKPYNPIIGEIFRCRYCRCTN